MAKKVHKIDPTILVLFGSTGHLSANYLMPALYSMDANGFLPDNLKVVCVGRRDLTTESYLDFIIKNSKGLKPLAKKRAKKHFLKHLIYYRGDIEQPESFQGLSELLADKEHPTHSCYNRLYYFATAPEFFDPIARILKKEGLLMSCGTHERKVRVLVEKPFGQDLHSARSLNSLLHKFFKEDQIYRIDHYLGKETVQNLMVIRFANALFEPLWNSDYIGHVEISVLEDARVGSRGPFYDKAGALKDIVQNHILQMLSLIAMEEPSELHTELIRDEKLKVLRSLKTFNKKSIRDNVVRGQYVGYEQEIDRSSQTETFFAAKVLLDLPRWKNVPFYIRTGKGLKRKVTEISLHFKEPVKCLFRNCAPNILTFRIQPDESVYLKINNKIPGFGVNLHHANLEFSYKETFKEVLPTAYERLLLDFLQGDQRLFIRSDEIEAAWNFVDNIIANWDEVNLESYKLKSSGPQSAQTLIAKDGHIWQTE